MWKGLGVVGLWGLLIAAPHALSAPADDPGDPFALAAPPEPAPTRAPPGSFATVHFKNEVGKAYALAEARFVMDGAPLPVLTNVKSGADVVIFAGRVLPGPHVVETRLAYRGNRRGLVTYMRKYQLTVESREVLTVPKEQAVQFTIAGKENKGFNVRFNEQLGIQVRDRVPTRALTN
jgi:hypothetical protein